jgi:hypothetical protein
MRSNLTKQDALAAIDDVVAFTKLRAKGYVTLAESYHKIPVDVRGRKSAIAPVIAKKEKATRDAFYQLVHLLDFRADLAGLEAEADDCVKLYYLTARNTFINRIRSQFNEDLTGYSAKGSKNYLANLRSAFILYGKAHDEWDAPTGYRYVLHSIKRAWNKTKGSHLSKGFKVHWSC